MYAHNIIKYVALECWDVICSAAPLAQFILYATTFLFFLPLLSFMRHSGYLHMTGVQPSDRNTPFPLLPFSPKGAPSGKNELMLNI